MSTMQSTIARIGAEEAAAKPVDDGWKPAGPVLTDEPNLTAAGTIGMAHIDRIRTFDRPTYGIPSIGNIVIFHLRDGDSRNMRTKFPAIVMDGSPETGKLKLWVIVDDGDTWMQDHVPAHAAPEPGWELVNPGPDELNVARLGDRVAALEVKNPSPAEANSTINRDAIIQMLNEHILALEGRIAALEAKRGPGRPPNPNKPRG